MVIRVAGQFTQHLSRLRPGDPVYLRGPYGNGIPELAADRVVLVGGVTGIASLLEIGARFRGAKLTFLLGARTRAHLFDLEKFEALGEVWIATDDGSAGHHGYVPALIEGAVREGGDLAFVNCGPEAMVRACFEVQRRYAPPERVYGPIEYMTSCGVGICGKCASPSGALTCIDGPFLPMSELAAPAA